MKIFVSQPMNGRTKEEVLEERTKCIEAYKAWLAKHVQDTLTMKVVTFEVIENYDKPHAPENAPRLWYLADSLKLMSEADYVIFAPGWKKAKGCKVEMMCCRLYNKPYIKLKKI